eukprot:3649136-Rhodomonas_salina.1
MVLRARCNMSGTDVAYGARHLRVVLPEPSRASAPYAPSASKTTPSATAGCVNPSSKEPPPTPKKRPHPEKEKKEEEKEREKKKDVGEFSFVSKRFPDQNGDAECGGSRWQAMAVVEAAKTVGLGLSKLDCMLLCLCYAESGTEGGDAASRRAG